MSKLSTVELPCESPVDRVIYVIDDDAEIRKSLHFLLSTMGIRSWPFGSGEDFLEQVAELAPSPILLDMRMRGIDGIGVLTGLLERNLDWPVIVMTGHGDIEIAVRSMKLGAIEFLEKPFEADVLEVAVAGAFGLIAKRLQERSHYAEAMRLMNRLTAREAEVIEGLIEGLPNKLVAHRLGLSTRTVEMHRANATAKLEGRSIAEIATLLAKVKVVGTSAAAFESAASGSQRSRSPSK